MTAVFCDMMLTIFKIQKRAMCFRRAKNNIAAFAAIAAVGTAARDVFFPAKADAAAAAVTGLDINFCLIYEFHKRHALQIKKALYRKAPRK